MTDGDCDRITAQRLAGWRRMLTAEHATPALVLGVGHDHNSGTVVLCYTEDVSTDDLRKLLTRALLEL